MGNPAAQVGQLPQVFYNNATYSNRAHIFSDY